MTQPFFRAVVRLRNAVLRTGNHVRVVTNLNDLLGRYPWINGVKTGHTLGAGYVLVASGTQHGMTLIDAVLGTPSEAARDEAALALLNWGFASFTLRTPVHAGQLIARVAITGGSPNETARLLAAATDTHVFAKGARISLRVHAPATLTGPLPANDTVGWVTVRDGGEVQARISPPARERPRSDQAFGRARQRVCPIGYAVWSSAGSGCGDRPDDVLARMVRG